MNEITLSSPTMIRAVHAASSAAVHRDDDDGHVPIRQTAAAAGSASLLGDVERSLRRAEIRLRSAVQYFDGAFQTPPMLYVEGDSLLKASSGEEEAERMTAASRQAAAARRQQMDGLASARGRIDPSTLSEEDAQALRSAGAEADAQMPSLTPSPDVRREAMDIDEGYVSDEDAGEVTGPAAEQGASGWQDDLFDEIFKLIQRLDTEWLGRFSDLLAKYVQFFNRLTDVMSLLKDSITDVKDGKLDVDFTKLREELTKLASGVGLGGNFRNDQEAQAFLDELGIEGLIITNNPPATTWQLAVDPTLINQLVDVFPKNPVSLDPAAHAAIISAKDSLMERFNHINRALPDKYQRQLQSWDTLVKTLSGTVDSMAESTGLILQNIS